MYRISGMALLVAVIALILVIPGCSSDDVSPPTPQENLAPDFQLPDLDGQLVTLSDLRGRPVLLNFWATWCGPCRLEMPFIQDIYEDEGFSDKGLVILAINIGEDSSTVKRFMVDNELTFAVLLDTDKKIASEYNIRAIPTTFFVDKDGIIRDIQVGAFPSKASIEQSLNSSIID